MRRIGGIYIVRAYKNYCSERDSSSFLYSIKSPADNPVPRRFYSGLQISQAFSAAVFQYRDINHGKPYFFRELSYAHFTFCQHYVYINYYHLLFTSKLFLHFRLLYGRRFG